MTDAPLLDVVDLRVTLRTARGPLRALRGISLRLGRGERLGLIGESGCGKSLTALALMGLLPEGAQVGGTRHFDGLALDVLDEAAWCALRGKRIAMVFQEPMTALNPLHRIGAQIAEALRLHAGLDAGAARAQALRLLDRVRLPQAAQRIDAYPHQLSGGQRQRVLIAIALACGPDLLIADEPTTALDATLQHEVLALIGELVSDAGMALLLISHDLALVADSVDRVQVLYAGAVVEGGPTAALFARLAHPYTRGLFAARPRLGLRAAAPGADAPRLPTIRGRVPDLATLGPGCAFAERCANAGADCRAGDPPARTLAPGHWVRCLRPEPAP